MHGLLHAGRVPSCRVMAASSLGAAAFVRASRFQTRIVLSSPAEASRLPLASTEMVKMLEGPPPFLVSSQRISTTLRRTEGTSQVAKPVGL